MLLKAEMVLLESLHTHTHCVTYNIALPVIPSGEAILSGYF